MRALITGTTGWLGKELALKLLEQGYTVVGLGRRPTAIPGVESICADITKDEDMAQIASTPAFDVIVHLSGVLGTCSIDQGLEVNVYGTRKLLKAGLAAGCKKFVLGSSIAVPGTWVPSHPPRKLPLPADHPFVGGDWPYALSKHMMEELVRCIAAAQADADFLLVRIGNTVTDPPEMVHHDGEGRQWKVGRTTGQEVGMMPECGLCTIALSDQIECLRLAVCATHKRGCRTVACVSPSSFSELPIPELMKSWYGEKAALIDLDHYKHPGHEFDPIYDLKPALDELGWEPKLRLEEDTRKPEGEVDKAIQLNYSEFKEAADGKEVHVLVTKDVPKDCQPDWLDMASELACSTWKEDGCLDYYFVRSAEAPERLVIVEKWASRVHLERHFKTEHFTRLVPAMDGISTTVRLDLCSDTLPVIREQTPSVSSVPNEEVHLIVTKEVLALSQKEWLKMATELAQATWKEDGCLDYHFVRSTDSMTRFVIVERWASKVHLEAHVKTEHFMRLVPAMDEISHLVGIDLCGDALPFRRADYTMGVVPFNREQGKSGKILVLYDSSTTCTEQMAALVAEGAHQLDRTEVRVRAVPGSTNHWDGSKVRKDPEAAFEDILWADGIAAGSPTNLGCVSWRMKKFWDDFSQAGYWAKIDGKIACSFSSVGGHAGGAELVNVAMNHILMNFGFAVFGVTDYVSFKETLHYGAVCAKAPRAETEQMCCRRLGRRLAEFVGLFIVGRPEVHPLVSSKGRDLARFGEVIPARSAEATELLKANLLPHINVESTAKTALLFTCMRDYQHESTPAVAAFFASLCVRAGWRFIVSHQAAMLEVGTAPDFDLIVLINNSGQCFDVQREVLTRHIDAGRPVMGVHAALAAFLDGQDATGATKLGSTNSFIKDTFGATFVNHPPPQNGLVTIDRKAAEGLADGGLAASLPEKFEVYDEFFNFSNVPKVDGVQVLACVDESTYSGGQHGNCHPVVWHFAKGPKQAKVFYSALGHFASEYSSLDGHIAKIYRAGFRHLTGSRV